MGPNLSVCNECLAEDRCICDLDCSSDHVLELGRINDELYDQISYWKNEAESVASKLADARTRNRELQITLDAARGAWRDE